MNSKKTMVIISIMLVSIFGIGSLLSNEATTIAGSRSGNVALVPQAAFPSAIFTNDSIAPDVNINLTKDGLNYTFTMQRIYEYVQNSTFKLSYINTTLNGVVHTWKGINPLYLMQVLQWDAGVVNITASDGFASTFDTSHFILRDKDFYGSSSYNATILVLTVTNDTYDDWLTGYTDSIKGWEGNFKIIGDSLSGKLSPKKVVQILYIKEWEVKVTVDSELKGTLSRENMTSIYGLNYTTYDWGYFDYTYGSNSGWPNKFAPETASLTGVTIASIVDTIGRLGDYREYTVQFLAVDGYGLAFTFSKDQIINGYTGYMINDSTNIVELSNEGKQAMLVMNATSNYMGYNGEYLSYKDGPYMLVVPGQSKSNYIKEIVEIRITTIADDCPDCPTCPTCEECKECEECPEQEDDSIPGYYPGILIAALSIGILLAIRKRK